jgi:branched-chain amino acid transport system substrate-binding protein
MKRALLVVLLIAGAIYWFGVRTMYYEPAARRRSDAGSIPWIQRGFTVAVVWPPYKDPSLLEGVQLAFDEINAGGGPLAGKIHLEVVREAGDAAAIARKLVQIRNLVLVIGHEIDGSAIPASVVYEDHGVLFFSPKSTDTRLTQHQFQFVFRLTPDDLEMTRAIGRFMLSRHWTRASVLHGRTDHGELASAAFVSLTNRSGAGLRLARVFSFFYEPVWYRQDFRPMIATLRAQSFDTIYLAAVLPGAAKLLVDLASMGVTQPIVATDKLDSLELWPLAGPATNGIYVASAVNPESEYPAFVSFRSRFRQRFGANPGYGAAQGYEALMLFAQASGRSQSADPLVLATTLRTQHWSGLFGDFSFSENGDVRGRDITIKQMQNGQFHPVFSDDNAPVDELH